MAGNSKFLPDSLSGALRSISYRVFGGVLFLFGLVCVIALLFHNASLDGFAAASTFGNQSIFGNIVGVARYVFGFIPSLFLFLCICRGGVLRAFGSDMDVAPEYNLMRGFVAIVLGAAGMGLIVPRAAFGGLIGALVAADVVGLIGTWAILVGIVCMAGFLVLAGLMLHIRWAHVMAIVHRIYRTVRTILSLFHLVSPMPVDDDDDADEDSDDDDVSDDEESDDDDDTDDVPAKPARARRTRRTVAIATGTGADAYADYELPDPKLLEKSNFGKNVVTPELKRNASAMEVHFAEYGVNGHVVGIKPGPIVTLYEFKPDSGTRMVDVTKTVGDMTRAMATENIRIAHIPRTDLIGVEMVNLNRQIVRFQGLVASDTFINTNYKIPLALGVDIGGNPMYFDLAKMPHMLIAGRTGSGKSVFVQSIITSIVYHFTPDKCKMIIIDPKGSDFGFWDDIPHLITPIIKNEVVQSINALKWATREMDDRYKKFQFIGAQNIEQYNSIVTQKRDAGETLTRQVAVGTDPETGELEYETQNVDLSDMPFIVIVIDEVADLMSLARKEVEGCIQRIAQKARAAGIHLVMATQRPDATTITGVIKANFPTRISFQARSNIDSMTTLGEKGAENLLGQGDMLFSEAGKTPVRIHAAFIDTPELKRIGAFLRSQGTPQYISGITDDVDGGISGAAPVPGGAAAARAGKDADLYEQAKQIVINDKKPTISYIQRRLGVGYNKAATFMERMEADGIVSAPDANNKRRIL